MRPHVSLTRAQLARAAGVVALGGAAGTLSRDLALRLQPVHVAHPGQSWTSLIPWVLLSINFVGVVVATWLLRVPLRAHDPNDSMRLLLVTGLLGGFTSYSGLVSDLAALWHRSVVGALVVALGAIGSGVVGAWIGLGRWLR